MKIGRGLFDLMSKNHGKCTSRGRWLFLYAAALLVLGLSLTLTGCGDLSLNQLLENQDAGVFTVNPQVVNLEVGKELTLTASGGFAPYRYVWVSGPNPDDLDTEKGIYKAPDSIVTSTEVVTLKGVDYFDNESVTQIMVHNPLTLNKTTHTMTDSETFDFDPIGGVGPSFTFTIDGEIHPWLNSSTGFFDPADPGIYFVEVTDSIGNMATARVTVWSAGDFGLAIDPSGANVIIDGGPVTFYAVNWSVSTTFSQEPTGVGSLDTSVANEASFSASSPGDSPGVVTISLDDSNETVTAWVNIVDADPGPFTVVPAPYAPGYTIPKSSNLTFTVSGGVRSYSFDILDKDGVGLPLGDLEILPASADEQQLIYHAPDRVINIWVTFTDSAGAYKEVKVKVQQ